MINLWNRNKKGERVVSKLYTAEEVDKLIAKLEKKISSNNGNNGSAKAKAKKK